MQLSFEFDHDNQIKKMKRLDYIPENFQSLIDLDDEYNLKMIMDYYEKAIEAIEKNNSYKSNCVKREPFIKYLEVLKTEYEILKTKQ